MNTITKLVEPAIYRVTIPGYLLLKHHLALPGRWDVTGGKNKRAHAYLTENGVAETVNLLQRIDLAVKPLPPKLLVDYLDATPTVKSNLLKQQWQDRLRKGRWTIKKYEAARVLVADEPHLRDEDKVTLRQNIDNEIFWLRDRRKGRRKRK